MRIFKHVCILILLYLPTVATAKQLPIVHHDLQVTADIQTGTLTVEDTLQFIPHDNKPSTIDFYLGQPFELQTTQTTPLPQRLAPTRYSMPLAANQPTITLKYQGKLASTANCAWLKQTCILLNNQGLFLDGNSQWYVQIPGYLHTFNLKLTLPSGWVSLSQGEATELGWREDKPQTSIYLIAGKFHVYPLTGHTPQVLAYLRTDDNALAQTYLNAAQQYLDSYSTLLGAYPYTKFAIVESFWETGWGMPSFTLLGSQVMRLPFIPYTSLPHEILHNWWGNGVYVADDSGNWSEGLTAYLADYRLKREKGEAVNYRRTALQNYALFVDQQGDIPLAQFHSRHDNTTQAIGYDKSLMVFHMLAQHLGEAKFIAGLRDFYQQYRFQPASFNDLLNTLGADASFQHQWLERAGAPHLALSNTLLKTTEQGYWLAFTLTQTQAAPAFELSIPVVVNFKDATPARTEYVKMTQQQQTFALSLTAPPKQLAIDPEFNVLRIPDSSEVPVTVGALYGKEAKTIVIAHKANQAMRNTWEQWAKELQAQDPSIQWQYDDAPAPTTPTVILLGGDNLLQENYFPNLQQPQERTDITYTLHEVGYDCAAHTLAMALRASAQTVVLLDALTPASWLRLLSKLPHYDQYSYVIFDNAQGSNLAKGQWPVTHSVLVTDLP